MKKSVVFKFILSLILVLAMSLSLMSCKQPDPTPTPSPSGTTAPTPSQTTTPTETQTPTPTTTPSETTAPTESPTPSTGTLLDEDFWNWYGSSSGGSQSIPTIDYTEIASLTGDGDYLVSPISYDGDLTIENSAFTGTLTFSTVDVSGKFTINTPSSTVALNGAMTVGDFMALTAENTLVINCTITITTSSGSIHVKKGNVIIDEKAVAQKTVNGSTVIIPVTININEQFVRANFIITVKAKIDLKTVNGSSFKIIVKTGDSVSITCEGDITVDTTATGTNSATVTAKSSNGSDINVTEICAHGESSKIVDDPKVKKTIECGEDPTTQADLQDALDTCDKVTLGSDIALTSPLIITREVKLDLNGHTISQATENTTFEADEDYLVGVKRGGYLTIEDTSDDHGGKILGGSKVCVKLTLKGESALADTALEGFLESDMAQLTVYHGSLISDGNFAIAGNGNRHGTRLVLDTEAGLIESKKYAAIYNPQLGYVTISGGTIKGVDSAMEVRAGDIEINAGTFEATASSYSVNSNTSGTTTKGAALAIAPHASGKVLRVRVNNDTVTPLAFNAVVPISIANPENNPKPTGNNAVEVQFNYGFTWDTTKSTAAVVIGDNVIDRFNITATVTAETQLPTLSNGYKWEDSGSYYVLTADTTTNP